jgi:threonine dehydrogenase-like Zn-dependent dehydrogenase
VASTEHDTRALVAVAAGSLRLEDVAPPVIGPDQLLVRVRVSAVSSGTERRMLHGHDGREDHGHPGWPQVGAFGYLAAGDVVAVGEDVSGFVVGDRVACGRRWGAHRGSLDVDAVSALRIPEGIGYLDAACAYWAVPPWCGILAAEAGPREPVAVVGLGPLGLCAVELLGPSRRPVLGIDPVARRRTLAAERGARTATPAELGPDASTDASTRASTDAGPVAVLECSGSQAGLELALRIVRPRGRVVLVGSLPPLHDLDLFWPLQNSGASIHPIHRPSDVSPQDGGSSSPRALHLPGMLERIGRGDLHLDDLCTAVVAPEDAVRAFDALHHEPERMVGLAIAWDGDLVRSA